MKKIGVILLLALSFQGFGQRKMKVEFNKVPTSFWNRTEFKVGYFGNMLWNPGLNGGAEYLIREKVKTKERKKGPKTIIKKTLLNGNFGFYWDPKSHIGTFTNYGILWRRTNPNGKQINVQFNPLGYYRSFLPETYEVSNNRVRKVPLPGRSYFAPSLSVGVGKLRKTSKLTGRYLNLNFMVLTPYNTNILPLVSITYGYRFKIQKNKK